MKVNKKTQLIGHKAAIYKLIPYGQSMSFLSAAGDGWVAAWDLEQGEDGQLVAQVDSNIFSLVHIPQTELLVLGAMNGHVYWNDLNKKETLKNIPTHKKGVFDLKIVHDKLWGLGADGNLSIWDIENMQLEATLDLSNQALRTIALHPILPIAALGSSDNSIYIINTEKITVLHQIVEAHTNSVFTLQFDETGDFLWSGGRDAQIIIRSVQHDYNIHHKIPAHLFTVNDLQFSPNKKWLASASRDKTIKIWDASTFKLLKVIDFEKNGGHLNSVNNVHWLNNQLLISAGDDRSLICWSIED